MRAGKGPGRNHMKSLFLIVALGLAGCAASQKNIDEVARTESARLMRPSKPLSSFAEYELRPLALGPAVQDDEKKVAQAAVLESRLQEKIQPLLTQWRASGPGARSGTLVIEPQLVGLRAVSGGARFWVGAMAGDSSIDLDLKLTEQPGGATIAMVRIDRNAGASTGGWSMGKSDKNLHEYIAAIAGQYLA